MTAATATAPERRNVLILAAAQAMFQTTSVLILTVSGLVGRQLAPRPEWATLPIVAMIVTAAVTMMPASFLMDRRGRRFGFVAGAGAGALAGVLAVVALGMKSFGLFVVANGLVGAYQGFAQYYRFAAIDTAKPLTRGRAVAWVVGGGVVAAFAGPTLAKVTLGWAATPFAASYAVIALLGVLACATLSQLRLPPRVTVQEQARARPLTAIVSQGVYLTALCVSTVGFGLMILLMTATPIAMHLCGFGVAAAANVIQWHVLAMFLPSFGTGRLIRRFGVLPVIGAGIVCMTASTVIAQTGLGLPQFVIGLVLLGLGWNFMYIGGTTLLAEAHQPVERAKAQAFHDFVVFAVLSVASFAAAGFGSPDGWRDLNRFATFPIALALAMVASMGLRRWRIRRSVVAS